MPHTNALGKWGEQLAAVFLEKKGYQILARNVYTPYGEIDLIASLKNVGCPHGENEPLGMIVFCEVKTRRSRTFGFPEISITPKKLEHMRHSVEYYINQHAEMGDTWRLDVISVEKYQTDGEAVITHFENIQVQ
jgi:putative endonuclease